MTSNERIETVFNWLYRVRFEDPEGLSHVAFVFPFVKSGLLGSEGWVDPTAFLAGTIAKRMQNLTKAKGYYLMDIHGIEDLEHNLKRRRDASRIRDLGCLVIRRHDKDPARFVCEIPDDYVYFKDRSTIALAAVPPFERGGRPVMTVLRAFQRTSRKISEVELPREQWLRLSEDRRHRLEEKKNIGSRFRPAVRLFRGITCSDCAKTMSPDEHTLDHWTPISKGGSSSLGNLYSMCESCNQKRRIRFVRTDVSENIHYQTIT